MGLSVITPASDNLLTTVQTVKAVLGVSDGDSDNLIELFIRQASDWIVSFTGRAFAQETVKETIGATGLPDILLSRTPIVSITTITFQGDEVTDYSIKDDKAGILYRDSGWTDTSLPWGTFEKEHPSSYLKEDWEFTYVGGYVLPNWATLVSPRTLPYDLERACIDLVKIQNSLVSRKIGPSVSRYRVGDTDISWALPSGGAVSSADGVYVPPEIRSVLSYYRRAF